MKRLIDHITGIFIVPIVLAIILVPFSMLIGWNLLTLSLFWFVLIPLLSLILPPLVSRNRSHLHESLIGFMIFYGIMVLMIYDHFKTDYFKIMIISFGVNLVLVTVIALAGKVKTRAK